MPYRSQIGEFHNEIYIPAIEKLRYHSNHFRILGKYYCGKERRAACKPTWALTRRDYAERLTAAFTLGTFFFSSVKEGVRP